MAGGTMGQAQPAGTGRVRGQAGPASTPTAECNDAAARALPFHDRDAFADADRGFVATIDPPVVTDAAGRTVFDARRYAFAAGDPAPATVHPSLWRMAQLTSRHGLYRVTDRVYQVRGFDLANMTVIVGDEGYVVVDPLLSVETSAAALALVRRELGDRTVTAVIVTHCHSDHFGGIKGVVDPSASGPAASGAVPIIAPAGFFDHAVSENVYAGTAMSRRSQYMYGALVPPDERGQVTAGLGMALSRGTVTLVEPTDVISETGRSIVLDGVEVVFQLTPGTEAPAEMNFHLPGLRALCMAENVAHTMHNLYTLRGAQIRDAAAWSGYLGQAAEWFAADSDAMFLGHHWPVWGSAAITDFLARQQDLYRYIHDETLRLAAHGMTMAEVAESIELPGELERFWSARGYYGTLKHNAKAVYQRYLGWFDGDPAHLDPHPPTAAAHRYVDFMGGSERVLANARRSFDEGDYRWVAEVVGHVVHADPADTAARSLQAAAFEQLGYQAESTSWRNFYLVGARELREGGPRERGAVPGRGTVGGDVVAAMSTDMLLDYLGIRLNGPAAAGHALTFAFEVSDTGEQRLVRLRRGVLAHSEPVRTGGACDPDARVRLRRSTLARLAVGGLDICEALRSGEVEVPAGSPDAVRTAFGLCDEFRPDFPIVTPRIGAPPTTGAQSRVDRIDAEQEPR